MPTNYGTVHVFNSYNEPVTGLSVSGYSAGNIDGWAASGATQYTPNQVSVPRCKYQGEVSGPAFAIGDNPVVIPWVSFRAAATITIPPPQSGVSLMDDLILYLTVNTAILVTTRGYVLNTFPISTTKLSDEDDQVQVPIQNVTVHKDVIGGTVILSGAAGNVNGANISVTPAGGSRWIPLPRLGYDYVIVEGATTNWSAVCTMPPANDTGTGYFTARLGQHGD